MDTEIPVVPMPAMALEADRVASDAVPAPSTPPPSVPLSPVTPPRPYVLADVPAQAAPLPTSPAAVGSTAPAVPPTAVWELVARQLADQGRSQGTQGTWGMVTRLALLVVGIVLAFRLVYDDVLPRLLLVTTLVAAGLVAGAMVLRALAEARRQRVLLIALTQLTRLARLDPSLRPVLGPQIDTLVATLREEPRVWPWAVRDGHSVGELLARYVPPAATLREPSQGATPAGLQDTRTAE